MVQSLRNSGEVPDWLSQYQPRLCLADLVEELNKIYHKFEAKDFERNHPFDFKQMPAVWDELVEELTCQNMGKRWRILNFGCGTGFEAEQALLKLPRESIELLVCYDLSSHMLSRCRAKISTLFPGAVFSTDLNDVLGCIEPYNLLMTNQMLHHLTDVVGTIEKLVPVLSKDAIWISGHEPSDRFLRNLECRRTYEEFLGHYRWRRLFQPQRYLNKFRYAVGLQENIEKLCAREAVRDGLFKYEPPPQVIIWLVDFQSTSNRQVEEKCLRGLDYEKLQEAFAGQWELIFLKTYNFMGPFDEIALPKKWAHAARELAREFPNDGHHYSAIWKRVGC